jgi:methionine synthase II (cobalamin-independent)
MPYRADQVGSFLRSDELKGAHTAHERGTVSAEELRALEDREILRVLEMQRAVGIDVLRMASTGAAAWASDFQSAVDGYGRDPPVVMTWHGGSRAWRRRAWTTGGVAVSRAPAPRRLRGE